MSDTKLGQLASESTMRDAIHIAIAPVIAGEDLGPGCHVGLNDHGEAIAVGIAQVSALGIVDPFLKHPCHKGDRFWLCLYQQTVIGMRHCWSHPAFPTEEANTAKGDAEAWLRNAASTAGVSFEHMMDGVESDDYIHMGENEAYKAIDYDLFKKHVQTLTGKTGASPPFSCSC